MRTSAAPTYFPSYQHYVDGGVFANNPSMAALAQALDAGTGGQVLGDLLILSLGTGLSSNVVSGNNLDWGIGQWASILPTMMIDGVMGVADYQCQRLLKDRYYRLSPPLASNIALDDVSQINNLIAAGQDTDITSVVTWLKKNWV
jgi:patatin-like phospholipase/acyl hydrolase